MGESKQRQDLVFLALAAAVLAVAVALFVVMRSVSKDGKEPAAPETQQEVAETPPEPPKPEPVEDRDPFTSQPKGSVASGGPAGPAPGPQVDLKFVGFTEGQGQGAIATIRRGERRYFVRVGQTVRGYTVTSIGQNRVVLTSAGGEAILLLREPEEEE